MSIAAVDHHTEFNSISEAIRILCAVNSPIQTQIGTRETLLLTSHLSVFVL